MWYNDGDDDGGNNNIEIYRALFPRQWLNGALQEIKSLKQIT